MDGPMIDPREVDRIDGWVHEAQASGARVLTGGKREGTVYYPTVLTNVQPDMKVVAEEAFAPVANVIAYDDFEEALRQADATSFGLQVGVFTRDIDRVFRAIKRLNFGGVIINDTPVFRADRMPYGGNRQSGLGREGAVRDGRRDQHSNGAFGWATRTISDLATRRHLHPLLQGLRACRIGFVGQCGVIIRRCPRWMTIQREQWAMAGQRRRWAPHDRRSGGRAASASATVPLACSRSADRSRRARRRAKSRKQSTSA
jgi:hypothetical protein